MANRHLLAATAGWLLIMPQMMVSRAAGAPAAPIAVVSPSYAPGAGLIERDTVWSGTVAINGKIQVLAGVTLVLEPGTKVIFGVSANRADVSEDRLYVQQGGKLTARGTASQPITFSSAAPGRKWFGIELHSGDDQTSFAFCRIQDSRMGISCVGSSPSIEQCVFTGNQMGVSMWRQSKPSIRNCEFLGNEVAIMAGMQSAPTVTSCDIEGSEKIGVSIEQDSGGVVEKSRFHRNKTGIAKRGPGDFLMALNSFDANETGVYIYQEGASAELRENSFTTNQQGVSVTAKASPLIARNTFDKNESAILFDGRSTGFVQGNDFAANQVGIRLSRTSSPAIARNLFAKNDLALLCEYSSYPSITANNFLGNATDIRAGDNQSFEWTRTIWPAEEWEKWAKSYGPNRIAAGNNYWGDETTRKMQAGATSIETIFDYQQSKEFLVKDKAYRRDEIDYRPFSPTPIKEAGTAGLAMNKPVP